MPNEMSDEKKNLDTPPTPEAQGKIASSVVEATPVPILSSEEIAAKKEQQGDAAVAKRKEITGDGVESKEKMPEAVYRNDVVIHAYSKAKGDVEIGQRSAWVIDHDDKIYIGSTKACVEYAFKKGKASFVSFRQGEKIHSTFEEIDKVSREYSLRNETKNVQDETDAQQPPKKKGLLGWGGKFWM